MLFDQSGFEGEYESLHVVRDAPSGLRAVVALHSTRRGPAFGGIRRTAYASEEEAVRDAVRLAAGMTAKLAFAGLEAGGGKTVILDHDRLDWAAAYRRLGEAIEGLGGRYHAGPDVGTGPRELARVREATRHATALGEELNDFTARGVLAGVRATLARLDGSPAFEGRRFAVQGLGAVGLAVARGLRAGGGDVVGADPSAKARETAQAEGVRVAPHERLPETACDVLVPCALGGTLTAAGVGRLKARAVCGAANNQLAEPAVAGALHARGVLYAPDFAVNAGAVTAGFFVVRDGNAPATLAKARDHVDGAEGRLAELFARAEREGRPPVDAAMALVRERLGGPP